MMAKISGVFGAGLIAWTQVETSFADCYLVNITIDTTKMSGIIGTAEAVVKFVDTRMVNITFTALLENAGIVNV